MHAEVCSVLVTASCVWNVDKYLVALQRLRVVDLIGQGVVGVLDLSGWREELGTLSNCGKYTKSYLPDFTGSGRRYVIIVLCNIYVILCLHMW